MVRHKFAPALFTMVLVLAGVAIAGQTDSNTLKSRGSLMRLEKKSGVYNASSTGKTPGFVVDPSWPHPAVAARLAARSGRRALRGPSMITCGY